MVDHPENGYHQSDSGDNGLNQPKHPLIQALDNAFGDARTKMLSEYYASFEEDEEEDRDIRVPTQSELAYIKHMQDMEQLLEQINKNEADAEEVYQQLYINNEAFRKHADTEKDKLVENYVAERYFYKGDVVRARHQGKIFTGTIVHTEIDKIDILHPHKGQRILVETNEKIDSSTSLDGYSISTSSMSTHTPIYFASEPANGKSLYSQKFERHQTNKEILVNWLYEESLPF